MPRPGLSPVPDTLVASLTGNNRTRQGLPPIRLVLDQAQSFDIQLRTDMIYQFSVRERGVSCTTSTAVPAFTCPGCKCLQEHH